MRVDPAADEEVVAVAEIEQFVVALFCGVACVACACLVGDHQVTDEQRIGDDCSAENAACLQVTVCVRMSVVQECCPQGRRQEDRP